MGQLLKRHKIIPIPWAWPYFSISQFHIGFGWDKYRKVLHAICDSNIGYYIFTKINIYPSIKISKTKKAVRLLAKKLTASTKKTINICLELIRFGMISTLIFFDGDYYEYQSSEKE